MVQASVDLPQAQNHGCWWWCCRVQGGAEGLQHLGSLPCVLSHESVGEKLRILQTNNQMLLEIQAKFMDIFYLPLLSNHLPEESSTPYQGWDRQQQKLLLS